ncbi:HMG box family protein [Histomonas meleagridis]|uniref:HMG box family protein n=1 Tax=Histomonas meleagridis TaxID=135588 RepID=UPI00355A99C6|nr:HMG box family protein [Histomonas meleagridis]KAH0801938.1 HMG box family protein [Histomonas meleagridis]
MYNPANPQPDYTAWQTQQTAAPQPTNDIEEADNSRRPPNAFILYSQTMRTEVRQKNPTLSNTEVSRILGKMWKEVPNEVKLQYKQKAASLQEEFKKEHPNYVYRKARRKRALNELLTKNNGFSNGYYDQMLQMSMMPMGMMTMNVMQGNQMGYPQQGMPQMGQINSMNQLQSYPQPQQQQGMYGSVNPGYSMPPEDK